MPKRAKAEKKLPAFDLKAARVERGLSQGAVCEVLHASQASVARWERDGSLPLIYRTHWALYWEVQELREEIKTRQKISRKVREARKAKTNE